MVPQMHGGRHRQRESGDTVAMIEARIRRALRSSAGTSALSRQSLAAEPHRSERRAVAVRLMDARADLVGFRLSSRLKGVGRATTLVREGLRRGLLEVLFRQTEFNRSSSELIRAHEEQLEALGATVRAQIGIQLGVEERLEALEAPARLRLDDLDFVSFVERFHGGPEERRAHLRRFLSRFEGRSEVIDAGCGRGEFLDLLREAAIPAVGVDHGDILGFLGAQPTGSVGGIFAGHLVERLERREIVEFVRLAFSRLRPGGVLVLEAVNPMCLSAYAGFYEDLTRVAPVPSLALQWLAESVGFVSVELEYASPVAEERKMTPLPASAGEGAEVEAFNRGVAAANELLFGFQEYALTAEKPG
jgi:hypothetical protein